MKVYFLNGNEMILNAGSIIIDAENPNNIKRLKNVPAVKNLISSIGELNGGEPYGTGNKVKVICPKLKGGLKVLARGEENIVTCNEITPITKITNSSSFHQYGVIYCDIFGGEKCFLTYSIKNGEFTYDFTRYCVLRQNDLDLKSKGISVIPVKIESENKIKKMTRQD